MGPVCSADVWPLVGSVGRALHLWWRGPGFDARTGRIFSVALQSLGCVWRFLFVLRPSCSPSPGIIYDIIVVLRLKKKTCLSSVGISSESAVFCRIVKAKVFCRLRKTGQAPPTKLSAHHMVHDFLLSSIQSVKVEKMEGFVEGVEGAQDSGNGFMLQAGRLKAPP
uniref:Uncharacterized protein n=1 Tax=Ixodes ricinus TaxID=34613 RepID=A0A6B0UXQ5_IXORI